MHLAIIPDGNRRFAKKYNLSLEEAYRKGIDKIKEVIEWLKEKDIKELTIWGFSTENFNREEKEKNTIWKLLREKLDELIEEYKKRDDERKKEIKICFFGHLEKIPEEVREKCYELQKLTDNNGKYRLNILLAYGGKSEIVYAINKAIDQKILELKSKEEQDNDGYYIKEEEIENNLMIKNPVDLLIRTGGEKRLSGYLLWQSSYSELAFCDKLWPEFTKDDLDEILNDFYSRERRFGR